MSHFKTLAFFSLGLALLLPLSSWAENWVFLREANDNTQTLDMDSVKHQANGMTSFLTKHRYHSEQNNGSVRYWETIHYMRFDCPSRKVSEDEQEARDANGNYVTSWDYEDYGEEYFPQNTYVPSDVSGDIEFRMVCK